MNTLNQLKFRVDFYSLFSAKIISSLTKCRHYVQPQLGFRQTFISKFWLSDDRLLLAALSWVHYNELLLPVIMILCIKKIMFHRTSVQTENYFVQIPSSGFKKAV